MLGLNLIDVSKMPVYAWLFAETFYVTIECVIIVYITLWQALVTTPGLFLDGGVRL